jgi:hypothetical protein
MTPHEVEISVRAAAELAKYLDADSAGSFTKSVPVASNGQDEDPKSSDPQLVSIAQRLAKRSLEVVEVRLDPAFEIRRVCENPDLWFYRFGAVALMSTAEDARQRARFQHGLGPRQVSELDLPIAIAMGATAKAAISDAAAALFSTHKNIAHLAYDLGMYATVMAIGRRYEAELLQLSQELKRAEFDQFIQRALHTSRIAACRELRQAAADLQHV